jgi:hypothetical protein
MFLVLSLSKHEGRARLLSEYYAHDHANYEQDPPSIGFIAFFG